MKYVRTKDKIIDVSYWSKDKKGYYTYLTDDFCEPKTYVYTKDIIAEDDNIERLCDAAVETKGHTGDYMHYIWWGYRYDELKPKIIDDMITQDFNVYGAIWTNKGLIYVAKMNKDGGYELL